MRARLSTTLSAALIAFCSAPLAAAESVTGVIPTHIEHTLGRFHVLLVHFPIALIAVGGLFAVMSAIRRTGEVSPTAFHCLWTGAVGALFAASTGWLFAHHDPVSGSVESDLFWHRWVGVATAATSLLAVICYLARRRSEKPFFVKTSRLFFTLAVILSAGAGHLGGDLAYGEGWVFAPFEAGRQAASSEPEEEVDTPAEIVDVEPVALIDYAAKIEPLLQRSCIRCHGARRQKGQLRLDQGAEIFAGEPKWWVVRPGDADASLLVQLTELPPHDLDVMPPEDEEPRLTEEQIALIRTWVDQGAPIDGTVHEWPGTGG